MRTVSLAHVAFLLSLFGVACAQPAPSPLEAPEAVFELPKILDEISGLTLLDAGLLGAVQDEDGTLFVIEAETGRVLEQKRFGKSGDYEGLERVGNRVFVLRSDGELFEIDDWRAADLDVQRHETGLHKGCDAEGLAYEAGRERLLIGCKEKPGADLAHHRAFYAYDLQRHRLAEAPVLVIDLDALDRQVETNGLNRALRSALKGNADLSPFKPSALAVHPVTGRVYVLSSVRKLMAVFEPDGALASLTPLPPDLLPQPEGLVITPDGKLFIASEGDGARARLVRYAAR